MAKKRRKSKRSRELPSDLPDWRVMAERMWGLDAAGENSSLAQAQALVYQAFEEPDESRRVELAQEALTICPDCADAYVLAGRTHPEPQRGSRTLPAGRIAMPLSADG